MVGLFASQATKIGKLDQKCPLRVLLAYFAKALLCAFLAKMAKKRGA